MSDKTTDATPRDGYEIPSQDSVAALRAARQALGAETACSLRAGRHEYLYSVKRLHALAASLPVIEVPLESLSHELDTDRWFFPYHYPTAREVVSHCKLILNADLNFPIILSAKGGILDGVHRVAKALLQGRTSIRAVQFEKNPEPDQIVENVWPAA